MLWRPPPDVLDTTQVGEYLRWLERERGLVFADYEALWSWSVHDLEAFWSSIWDHFQVRSSAPHRCVLGSRTMPGAQWFPGALLNYAEHLVATEAREADEAVVSRSSTRGDVSLTFGELRDQVGRARAGLQRLGVGRGDRVVGYLPNVPETVVAFIATASLGAIWASCAPEIGWRSAVGRFGQITPKVLIAVGGYLHRGRPIDRRDDVEQMRTMLPSVEHVVGLDFGPHPVARSTAWSELIAQPGPLDFDQVPFDHPLCILFSSGTTGLPKPIVHGHGGLLVEHLKHQALHWELHPGSRFMWYSTTSWMMWNIVVSALLRGATIILIDGDPTFPTLDTQWRLVEEFAPSFLGLSPPYLMACRKAGMHPGRDFDLSSVEVIGVGGAPLPAAGYRYVFDEFGPDVLLDNSSGGTDICSGIVGGGMLQPVRAGYIAGRLLGVAADAFDENGHPVVGELGELVITAPMPSMPVRFWGDEDGVRYREAYFDLYPGVWRQGDWIQFEPDGGCMITGRSDGTLNRGGVRLGTSEFYDVVDEIPEVADSLVVHLEDRDGGAGELVLVVVLAGGAVLDHTLRARLVTDLRTQLSPRHVPDQILVAQAVPRTLTGKRMERPVKQVLQGRPAEEVLTRDALLDPSAFDAVVGLATDRRLLGG